MLTGNHAKPGRIHVGVWMVVSWGYSGLSLTLCSVVTVGLSWLRQGPCLQLMLEFDMQTLCVWECTTYRMLVLFASVGARHLPEGCDYLLEGAMLDICSVCYLGKRYVSCGETCLDSVMNMHRAVAVSSLVSQMPGHLSRHKP
jgi:hypothetical protein